MADNIIKENFYKLGLPYIVLKIRKCNLAGKIKVGHKYFVSFPTLK